MANPKDPGRTSGYDVEALVPDFEAFMAGYGAESARVKAAVPGRLDVAYGSDPLQRLDVFAPERRGAPVQVYIHGGAWRASDKAGRAYPAEAFVPAGAVWAPVNYRLAPAVPLDDIVHDVRLAIAWIHENAEEFGGDRERIFVSGNSAGGHLAAMLLADGWEARYGLPGGVVRGGCAVSGIFDLRPLWRTGTYDWLGLDEAGACRNSPILCVPATGRPLVVAVGGEETGAFKQQSRAFAEAWAAKGHPVRVLEMPGHHHFSIMAELARQGSPLLDAMLDQMGLADSR